jgi:hypothetical protein
MEEPRVNNSTWVCRDLFGHCTVPSLVHTNGETSAGFESFDGLCLVKICEVFGLQRYQIYFQGTIGMNEDKH